MKNVEGQTGGLTSTVWSHVIYLDHVTLESVWVFQSYLQK